MMDKPQLPPIARYIPMVFADYFYGGKKNQGQTDEKRRKMG